MRLFNLLTPEQSMILETLKGWKVREVDAVTEDFAVAVDVIAAASTRHYRKTPGSLRLDINNVEVGKNIELRTDPGVTIVPNQNYRTFAWIKPDSEMMLHIQICFYDSSDRLLTDFQSEDVQFLGEHRDWHLVSIEGQAPVDAAYAQVCIRVMGEMLSTPATLYVDDIVLTPYEVPWDPFFLLCARHLPEYLRLTDLEQTSPSQPMFRYLAVAIADAERMFRAVTGFDRAPASDLVRPIYRNCTLADPSAYPQEDVAEARWLPWLAQVTGAVNVNANAAGLTTTWSTLQANLASWQDVETLVDSSSLEFSFTNSKLTLIERSNGVVFATLTDVSKIAVGQSVVVSGDNEWYGEFVVDSVDGNVVSWLHAGSTTESSNGSLLLQFSDTEWSELEVAFPDSFDSTVVLSHLVRSGGTGVWAGTFEGIRRTVRSVLRGIEVDATLTRDGEGGLSIQFDEPFLVAAGQQLDVYMCDDATFDSRVEIISTTDDHLYATASQDGPAGVQRCVISERLVDVEVADPVDDPYLLTLRTLPGQSPSVLVLLEAANLAKPAGWVVQYESLSED